MTHAPLVATWLAQAVADAGKHHGPLYPVTHGLARFGEWISRIFAPLGLWGLAGLALLDSALVPLPGGIITWVVFYVAREHQNPLLSALIAAALSTIGSLLPFYIGRAGGEALLLRKVDRRRYERMRDRFERQEFLAVMLPAMCPPPMPLKVFELAAGVFEMRVRSYTSALFIGKFVQFLAVALLAVKYGMATTTILEGAVRTHGRGILVVVGLLLIVLALWMVRRMFARRAERLPIEEDAAAPSTGTHTVVEE